jgi:predicted RNA-binding Zn-ribbon protein involved in translation (DUF1610 family)
MGMFDEVNVSCTTCGSIVSFQSKAGECVLATFSKDSVPIEIANDIDGDTELCPDCGEPTTIHSMVVEKKTPMFTS